MDQTQSEYNDFKKNQVLLDSLKSNFLTKNNLSEADVLFVPYGSRVYGTASEKSDFDFLLIVPNQCPLPTGHEYLNGLLNLQICHKADFQEQLNQHKIKALECWYMPHALMPAEGIKHIGAHFKFDLDLQILRSSISEKASHSFVKAKKKIDKEKDYYIGWKSLFHSLRILNFGIQIAKSKTINFSDANSYWYEILAAKCYDWSFFKETYQPVFNSLASEFRKLAPKEK